MTPTSDLSLTERFYLPPKRRLGNTTGIEAVSDPRFGTYNYKYKDIDFIVYIALGQDGFSINLNHFLLTPVADKSEAATEAAQAKADDLLKTIAQWSEDLHREVLVFDQGFWQKNTELYNNIEKAKWKDVILDAERKETIINDVLGFFKSGERYKEYGVPWKVCQVFIHIYFMLTDQIYREELSSTDHLEMVKPSLPKPLCMTYQRRHLPPSVISMSSPSSPILDQKGAFETSLRKPDNRHPVF